MTTGENTAPSSRVDTLEDSGYQQVPTPTKTPEDRYPAICNTDDFKAYDPVEAGDLSEVVASQLLDEYKASFVPDFPFVLVPPNVGATALRRSQPFLFLCIMAVASYRTPLTQRALSIKLKLQIASRVIERSHKSLEILQGLLVYCGWYHFFYRPANQQLAILIQLCVAMVQDLALSKNPQKGRKLRLTDDPLSTSITERSPAGERAFLGTYYISCWVAQAWRKRATMQHTRYMAQCAERLTTRLEYVTDALMAPLIQLSELVCRINNFFSYDDVDNAEVKGELMLELSTTNFSTELDRIRDTAPLIVKNNPTFDANFRLLEIWIHECGLHTSLWNTSPSKLNPHSPVRLRILHRCLESTKSYVNGLLSAPFSSLHHLSAPHWAGWFYSIVVGCKLVFLEENERESLTDIEATDRQVTRLMTDHFDGDLPHAAFPLPAVTEPEPAMRKSSWDPVSVAKEADLQGLFDQFIEKMRFSVPTDAAAKESENFGTYAPNNTSTIGRRLELKLFKRRYTDFFFPPLIDPLFCMTCLQLSLSQGFTKRMKEHLTRTRTTTNNTLHPTNLNAYPTPQPSIHLPHVPQYPPPTHLPTHNPTTTSTPQNPNPATQIPNANHAIPIMNTFHFNSLNFDSIAMPDAEQPFQAFTDDWLWDMVMDDFAMPPL
ncbi:hypothetical protein CC80DRAFT_204263 [Byssothecium circinans]|uniref:Transcription factor domain-containing protein n=1 Tax=Byssothecium circinans TaxID=147558 RepID=A0A6A5THH6_9PLEO|nr:hypothetical protein CC80DRAFT_204263 [Byssothecium circinans]